MGKNDVLIRFSPLFMWSTFGKAKIMVDHEVFNETKNETNLQFYDHLDHSIFINFNQLKTEEIKANKTNPIILLCGIKYNLIRLALKLMTITFLLFFYYYLIQINNRALTNYGYKVYFACALVSFTCFCLDSFLNYLIEKNPKNFIYFRKINPKKAR